jgi:hypothetical protein
MIAFVDPDVCMSGYGLYGGIFNGVFWGDITSFMSSGVSNGVFTATLHIVLCLLSPDINLYVFPQ